MIQLHYIIIYFLVLTNFIINKIEADDVFGCNGFVKSDIEIDFLKVEIKLFTKQGSLKDRTECAPNNGYYFLPLYDKGEYILKVAPPYGWAFEPPEVPLIVDGESDACSQGKDINFIFKGFAITGKVLTEGHSVGPKGVLVHLWENKGEKKNSVRETVTKENGDFVFSPVFPGKYIVTISHPRWTLGNSITNVIVQSDNGEAKGLTIAGYDVTGTVFSDGQPISGVRFILFTDSSQPLKVHGCETGHLEGFTGGESPVCHVASIDNGSFVFPQLPPGTYTLIPHYAATSTKFHVHPRTLKFKLLHSSLNLDTPFQVKGFSVTGRVLWSPKGKPLPGAVIKLNGKAVGISGQDGVYNLESMKAGTYLLHVEANDLEFSKMETKVSATTLPDIFPSAYKVCGKLIPATAGVFIHLDGVGITKEIETSANGSYCFYLPVGVYIVSIVQKENREEPSQVQYSPSSLRFEVVDRPVDNINFLQLKCTVKGKIKCRNDCPLITINLKPKDSGSTLRTIAKGGEYEFKEVPPGEYDVFIGAGLEWCWDKETQRVRVNSELTVVPTFIQSGRTMTILSSHTTKVMYRSAEGGEEREVIVNRGRSHVCVDSSGPVILNPGGCHAYRPEIIKWESGIIKLEPLTHANTFYIRSLDPADQFINVDVVTTKESSLSSNKSIIATLLSDNKKKSDSGGKFIYQIVAQLRAGDRVKLIPSAPDLLFNPPYKEIDGESDCYEYAQPLFEAEKGLILKGRVKTADNKGLEGVSIKVIDSADKIISIQHTHRDGNYKFEPIRKSIHYRVIAEKEGFVLTESPNQPGQFSAHKLAEISVTVSDNGKALQGVLLSLSGGESYRRNAQTNSTGVMSFMSLSPGEYFLKAMMKEYSFKPAGKIIQVQEGVTINVELSGERVAWSGFGKVISLNGEGESSVTVEAIGIGNCSLLQEEAMSGANGAFRIRGLQPYCKYNVHVKEGPDINTHIQTSTPENIFIEVSNSDIDGLILYALRRISRTDIVVLVRFTEDDELRLAGKLRLAREDSLESPILTVKLSDYAPRGVSYRLTNAVVVALGRVVADGQSYIVSAGSGRAVTLKADAPLRLVRITLTPSTPTPPAYPDISKPLYPPALPLIILGALVMYYRKRLLEFFPDLNIGSAQSEDSEDSSGRGKKSKLRKT